MTRQDKLKTLYRQLDELEWQNTSDSKAMTGIRTEIRRMQSRNSFGQLEVTIFFMVAFALIPFVVFYTCTMYYGWTNFFSQIKHHYKSLFELVDEDWV